MPVYEYECERHGVFESQRPMRDAHSACVCPTCGFNSRRVLSVANVPAMSAGNRKAHAVNERSCFEPRLVKREAAPATDEPRLHAGHGRPWAIGH